jgi:hypothetical protein
MISALNILKIMLRNSNITHNQHLFCNNISYIFLYQIFDFLEIGTISKIMLLIQIVLGYIETFVPFEWG